MMYNSNYTASRAAIKEYERVYMSRRKDLAQFFLQVVYNEWLSVEGTMGRIGQLAGYMAARRTNSKYVALAYQKARFVGPPAPQIDPVKEVEAYRRKLGKRAAEMPLTTPSAAAEALGEGEWAENMEQFNREWEQVPDEFKGPKQTAEPPPPGQGAGGSGNDD